MWSGGLSDFYANFGYIFRILAPKPGGGGGGGGGLNTLRKVPKPAHSVFKDFLVYPSFWLSFIEIGVMACITPAWSSHELSLKNTVPNDSDISLTACKHAYNYLTKPARLFFLLSELYGRGSIENKALKNE